MSKSHSFYQKQQREYQDQYTGQNTINSQSDSLSKEKFQAFLKRQKHVYNRKSKQQNKTNFWIQNHQQENILNDKRSAQDIWKQQIQDNSFSPCHNQKRKVQEQRMQKLKKFKLPQSIGHRSLYKLNKSQESLSQSGSSIRHNHFPRSISPNLFKSEHQSLQYQIFDKINFSYLNYMKSIFNFKNKYRMKKKSLSKQNFIQFIKNEQLKEESRSMHKILNQQDWKKLEKAKSDCNLNIERLIPSQKFFEELQRGEESFKLNLEKHSPYLRIEEDCQSQFKPQKRLTALSTLQPDSQRNDNKNQKNTKNIYFQFAVETKQSEEQENDYNLPVS